MGVPLPEAIVDPVGTLRDLATGHVSRMKGARTVFGSVVDPTR